MRVGALKERFGKVCGEATEALENGVRAAAGPAGGARPAVVPCLSGIVTRRKGDARKHQKSMYKAHVKALFACLNECVPDGAAAAAASAKRAERSADRPTHSGEAALYVVERIASLKGVLPVKYLQKVAARLQQHAPRAIPLNSGRDFYVRCQLHRWSLDFAATVVQEEEIEDLAQQEVTRLLLAFLRTTQRAIAASGHRTDVQGELHRELFDYCYSVLLDLSSIAVAATIGDNDEENSQVQCNSVKSTRASSSEKRRRNNDNDDSVTALARAAPRQPDLLLLLDQLIAVSTRCRAPSKTAISTAMAQRRQILIKTMMSYTATSTSTAKHKTRKSSPLWDSEVPRTLAKLAQIRCGRGWNHTAGDAGDEKEIASLGRTFERATARLCLASDSDHATKHQVAEVFRSMVAHVRAMQQRRLHNRVATGGSSTDGGHNDTTISTLYKCWMWLGDLLVSDGAQPIVVDLIPQCSDVVAKVVELAVVCFKRRDAEPKQPFAEPAAVLKTVSRSHAWVSSAVAAAKGEKRNFCSGNRDAIDDGEGSKIAARVAGAPGPSNAIVDKILKLLSCFGRVSFLAAQALCERGQYKSAYAAARRSCQSCEKWLDLNERQRLSKDQSVSAAASTLWGKSRNILMHRYDFVRMTARDSGCPELLHDALAAAHQSLKYCSSKDGGLLRTRTQRVVGCEIAVLKNNNLPEEEESLLLKSNRSSPVRMSILLHAAAAYRFYYRNNIGGGSAASDNAAAAAAPDISKRVLDWCKHNHSSALKAAAKSLSSSSSLSAASSVLTLACEVERVQFLRERVASQGAPTDSEGGGDEGGGDGKSLFNKILKNRKRIYKQATTAVKAAIKVEEEVKGRAAVEEGDSANGTASLLVAAMAHMLQALVQIESTPQRQSPRSVDGEVTIVQGMMALDATACRRAVSAIEAAVKLCVSSDASRRIDRGDSGIKLRSAALWFDVRSLRTQLEGFTYMLQIHGFHTLHLRHARAMELLGDFFAAMTSGNAATSASAETASLARVLAELEYGQWSVKRARKFLKGLVKERSKTASPSCSETDISPAVLTDICEVHLLTAHGTTLTDTELDRVKRLDTKFSARRRQREEVDSGNRGDLTESTMTKKTTKKKKKLVPETLNASTLWAESQCHDVIGRPIASLKSALKSLDIRKRLGHREGTLDQSAQELIDEAAANNMGLTPVDDRQERLLPMIRMDQWVLLRDFFESLRQLIRLFTARGLPHKAEYWILQAMSWAKNLGSCHLVKTFHFECHMLEMWTGRQIRGPREESDGETKEKSKRKQNSTGESEEKSTKVEISHGSILMQLQRRRETVEADARAHLCKGDFTESCALYEKAISLKRVLNSCIDVSLNRDLCRGLAFARTRLLTQARGQQQGREELDADPMKAAAWVAIGSMGMAFEMEHYTRRDSFRRKQKKLNGSASKGYLPEKKSSSLVLFGSASDAGSVVNLQELEDRVAQAAANLPELLSVVSMSWDPDVGLNIANVRGTAQTKGAICTAAFRSAADCAISQVGEMFDDVVLRSDNSTISSTIDPSKITAAFKAEWWEKRRGLDGDMHHIIDSLQHVCLGWAAAFVVGCVRPGKNVDAQAQLKCEKDLIALGEQTAKKTECDGSEHRVAMMRVLFSGCDVLTRNALIEGIVTISGEGSCSLSEIAAEAADRACEILEIYIKKVWSLTAKPDMVAALKSRGLATSGKKADLLARLCQSDGRRILLSADKEVSGDRVNKIGILDRLPVVLLLDAALQRMPWESMPCLRTHRVSRMPSLASVIRAYEDHARCELQQPGRQQKQVDDSGQAVRCVQRNVGDGQTEYIINPGGDLKRTEKKFRDTFERFSSECGVTWSGTFGCPPSAEAYYNDILPRCGMIVYCGHGSSEAFFKRKRVAESRVQGAVVLMGCSSGKLRQEGRFDPHGMVHAYLTGGSPLVVSNLWDVTDKDIDRFCIDLVGRMISGDKNGEGGHVEEAKCSRVCSLPLDTTTGNTSGKNWVDALGAVSSAREVCEMKWMIGAAPVCYGVPLEVSCA